MNTNTTEYRQKLTTPKKAVTRIMSGDTIVHGLSIGEFYSPERRGLSCGATF